MTRAATKEVTNMTKVVMVFVTAIAAFAITGCGGGEGGGNNSSKSASAAPGTRRARSVALTRAALLT